MKRIIVLIFTFMIFLVGCSSKNSVESVINEHPSSENLIAVYDESILSKSISVGDNLDNYIDNFKLTYNNGNSLIPIQVTKDMILLDTSIVGERTATITYKGVKTTVSVPICTPKSNFTRSGNSIIDYSGADSIVVLPRYIDGVEIYTLGNSVFNGNSTLVDIIAKNISYIDNGTFSPGYIGTFANCTSLTSIDFPEVTIIGNSAFYNCKSLKSIDLPLVTNIGWYAFYGCSKLISIDFPVLKAIDSLAFSECTALSSINFPLVMSVGESAFNNCTNLNSVSLPKVTYIRDYTFNNCEGLTTVNIPLVKDIGSYAFGYCMRLVSIILPKVTSIETYAFRYCTSLQSVTFGETSPPTLENYIFANGGAYKSWKIYVPSGTHSEYSLAFSNAVETFYNTAAPTYVEY